MKILQLLLALIVAAAVATLVIPWVTQKIEEPFQGSTTCPTDSSPITFVKEKTKDMPSDWDSTVKTGQQFFNRLADVLGESGRPDWSKTSYTKGGVVDYDAINAGIRQALENRDVLPVSDPRATYEPVVSLTRASATDPTTSFSPGPAFNVTNRLDMTKNLTGLGSSMSYVEERYPPLSGQFEKALKCQKDIPISLTQSRLSACAKLATNGECGVCIKGGTAYNSPSTTDKYMGGLYISQREKEKALARAKASGQTVQYNPTVGKCPDGYFFVDKDSCEKAVNRLNCEEYGGFGSTVDLVDGTTAKTLESQCVACPNRDPIDKVKYLYKKTATQNINVRVAVPAGTGRNRILVLNPNATTKQLKDIIFYSNRLDKDTTAVDILNTARFGLTGIAPRTSLQFIVIQEFPHRPRGEKEVFFVRPLSNDFILKHGLVNYANANMYAQSIGCRLATLAELTSYNQSGGQVAGAGWIAEDETNVYTSHLTNDLSGAVVNASNAGVVPIAAEKVDESMGCWCYGIKPAQSFLARTDIPNTITNYGAITPRREFSPNVSNFYEYVERKVEVDDSLKQARYSIFGDSNAAPNYRGVAIQFEMGSDVQEAYARRREPVERSMTKISSTSILDKTDDSKRATDYLNNYKRLGLFNQSQMIREPKPDQAPDMLQNQYWLWGTNPKDFLFEFTVEVPGYFSDPDYPEDIQTCPTGALLTSKKALNLYSISPCEGKLDDAGCLQYLFVKVGGSSNGELYPKAKDDNNYKTIRYKDYVLPSGATNINPPTDKRTEAEMEAFLQSKMDIIKRGIYPAGTENKDKRTMLENAGKQMLGKPTITPCQTVTEFASGENSIMDKADLDAMCLDYLYRQTGEPNPTYGSTTSPIDDKYSGIKPSELASEATREANPYRTCQPSGTWAPIRSDGTPNDTAITQIKKAMDVIMTSASPSAKPTAVKAARDVFNKIYQTANTSNPDPSKAEEQSKALEQCYGVVKKQSLTNCKGVQALKVRVLPSAFLFDSKGTAPARIATTGVTVKDVNGSALTTSFSAVCNNTVKDLSSYTDYSENAACDVAKSNITLDLGGTKSLSHVEFTPIKDMGGYANGLVIQLLRDATTVAAQRVLLPTTGTSLTAFFTTDDFRPLLPYEALRTNLRLRLETAIYPGYVLTSNDAGTLRVATTETTAAYNNSILTTATDKNGFGSSKPIYALRSDNLGDMFVTVANDSTLTIKNLSNNQRFQTWSSWAIQPALNGAIGFVSLESATFPGYYVVPYRIDGGSTFGVHVEPLDLSSDLHKFRASWRILPVD